MNKLLFLLLASCNYTLVKTSDLNTNPDPRPVKLRVLSYYDKQMECQSASQGQCGFQLMNCTANRMGYGVTADQPFNMWCTTNVIIDKE